jgi:DNA-binding SARP family transcriptional activator
VAALTFAAPATATLAAAAPPAAAAVAAAPAAPPAAHPPDRPPPSTASSDDSGTDSAAYRLVTVRPGDCLWTIAQHYLGAGDRYPEIVALNLGREMGDGRAFTTPGLIYSGWHLHVPAASVPAAPPHARSTSHSGHRSRHPQFAHPHPAAAPGPADVTVAPAASLQYQQQPGAVSHQQLPAIEVFAAGMLAGGAAVTLAMMRHRQRQRRRPGRRIQLPASTSALRAEQRINAARPPVPPPALRAALRELAAGLAASGHALPGIAGVHLTAGNLEVLLTTPAAAPPPEPFQVAPGRQGMCWQLTLPAGISGYPDHASGSTGDLMPGLFTAGVTDAGGYLLLDAEAMPVTSCQGPAGIVDRVLATTAVELATSQWSGWYDVILVGCADLSRIGRAETCLDLDDALGILAARRAAIASRLPEGGADAVRYMRLTQPEDADLTLSLLVSRIPPSAGQMARLLDLAAGGGIAAIVAEGGDSQAPASLQLSDDPSLPGGIISHVRPLQITVRPQALTVDEYASIGGLFGAAVDLRDVSASEPPYDAYAGPGWIPMAGTLQTPPAASRWPSEPADGGDDGDRGGGDDGDGGDDDGRLGADPGGGNDGDTVALPGRASLQVKILGPFEITGAAATLQPKQAELVLALALNGPSGLSNSALCTLLGPDPDHPKPSDSLRQIITRTRRRLGPAPDGREYIEHVGNGRYVLHEAATLDWSAFHALAERGRGGAQAEDLRAAVILIRGEPFGGVYHWWLDVPLLETVRAEVVDTAELLASLELAAGDPAAAGRAARAGLAVDVASEQLWRALMRAEDAAGNVAGVRKAWKHCLDAISDIDPDGEPAPDTAALYRQITRRAGARQPAGAA